jgi:hypothetical protein
MQACGVILSPEDRVLAEGLPDAYQALQDALWADAVAREATAAAFLGEADAAASALRQRAVDVRLIAQHEALADPETHPKDGLV